MKRAICWLRRRHDWKVWHTDDDRCATCGLFRLWPSGDLVRLDLDSPTVYNKALTAAQVAAHYLPGDPVEQVASAPAESVLIAPGPPPGPRSRPSELAERLAAR